jgi:hypothetical protein
MISQKEYNALLHAIWHLDRLIAENTNGEKSEITDRLNRDRQALSDLFNRLTEPMAVTR